MDPTDPRRGPSPVPWSALDRLALSALAIGALAAMPWLWRRSYASTLAYAADGAIYWICARNLLRGAGYSYFGLPFTIRPPGFAVLLLPCVALFGLDPVPPTLLVYLSGILALALLFALERERLGAPVALGCCAVVWASPLLQQLSNQIMSDVPSLAMMLGAFVLERHARRRGSLALDVACGALVGAAVLMRTVNVLLVPAFVLGRLVPSEAPVRPLRRLAPGLAALVVVPFLVVLPWGLRNRAVSSDGAVDHTLLHSYTVAMFHEDIADPDSPVIGLPTFLERVGERLEDIVSVLGTRTTGLGAGPLEVATTLALLACWLYVLARRREASDWCLGGMLALASVYFAFQPRLLLPVWALLVPAVARAALDLARRLAGERAGTALVTLGLVAWAAWDFDRQEHFHRSLERGMDAFQDTVELVEEEFEPDARLAAGQAAHFSLFLDRPVRSHRGAMREGGVAGGLEFLERYGIEGVVLVRSRAPDRVLLAALTGDGGRARVLGRFGPFVVLRM